MLNGSRIKPPLTLQPLSSPDIIKYHANPYNINFFYSIKKIQLKIINLSFNEHLIPIFNNTWNCSTLKYGHGYTLRCHGIKRNHGKHPKVWMHITLIKVKPGLGRACKREWVWERYLLLILCCIQVNAKVVIFHHCSVGKNNEDTAHMCSTQSTPMSFIHSLMHPLVRFQDSITSVFIYSDIYYR